ncbi:MAG: type II toxin-antitoxin system Phd/YefM family antitoxin [Clostridiales bacterium]|nr:type II toxin-antitoxin system Phd/YefM family antitoxin [Clostridiales bacterium]
MTAINATTARKNLYQLISDVNTNSTPVTITNSRGKNAVLLSEDDWNAIQETLYLNSVPGLVESILEAKDEPLEDSAVYEEEEEW